jgi:hypothetical protein
LEVTKYSDLGSSPALKTLTGWVLSVTTPPTARLKKKLKLNPVHAYNAVFGRTRISSHLKPGLKIFDAR